MPLDFFNAPGRFWRGNLHTHSTNSDGALDPQEVCRRYRAEGYDFISLTDHFVGLFGYPISDTAPFHEDGFTTIYGAELHSGRMHNGEIWHILAVGLPRGFEPGNAPHFTPVDDQESGPELARRAREAGAFVSVAHPQWSGMNLDDARSIDAAHAVETYNHGCAVECDRPDGFHTLDLLLSERRRLNLIATDDAHFHGPDAFGGWVMVKSERNEPEALLQALKDGHFYSSQGPQIHGIDISDKRVRVRCSAVSSVIVQGHGSAAKAALGASMTDAEVPLARFSDSPWIRVTVMDAAGRRAWSNPIWLQDL